MKNSRTLFGPFSQIITMKDMPMAGPIDDDKLDIINQGSILVENDHILEIGSFEKLKSNVDLHTTAISEMDNELVLMPGFVDAHTHICYAGSRAGEYAKRMAGKTYLEIAREGGGIMSTVRETRKASLDELMDNLDERCSSQLNEGITTCEVKSGYGLTVRDELKMLQAINTVNKNHKIDLIPTALPAHVCPPEFDDPNEYIKLIIGELLPEIVKQNLAKRIDIYIDKGAFQTDHGRILLDAAKKENIDITIHADQFSIAGSHLAAEYHAKSADHLETSRKNEIKLLSENRVTGTVLPGASLGLGQHFAPARKMLDAGMSLAIASDWNPGSAPMGDLLIQACLLGAFEKLTIAETLAGITYQAATALCCKDKGVLDAQYKADMIAFPVQNYQEIFYRQGKIKPTHVWKNGKKVK